MKYIILTNSIGGYSGGPTYVRKKLLYLKEKGWEVQVFDCTGFGYLDIKIEELKEFENNRFQELFFNPYWIRKARRKKIIATILERIGIDDRVVIESNTVAMSLWGELVASRIGAKHLVYLLSERLTITDDSLYGFYKYKSQRGELFSISAKAYKHLMERYEEISDAEADKHFWSAVISVPIEDVYCEELTSVQKADFNIGHLGREKGYFGYMIEQLAKFAQRHQGESINFIMLGVSEIPLKWRNVLPTNVHLTLIPSRQPVPKKFYDYSDVVIATAGCAIMSFRYGVKVISMDVYNNMPLGVLGYDTLDRNLRSDDNNYCLPLDDTLENVLVNKIYDNRQVRIIPYAGKGHNYHLSFATIPDGQYYDVSHIVMTNKISYSFATKALLSLNMVNACSKIRYWMTGHKNK